MDKDEIEPAMEEMDYEMVENMAGLELPVSTPASLEFKEPVDLDEDALESEFDAHDFVMFDVNSQVKENGDFYCYFDLMTDHYKRLKVKLWRRDVRIFPQEDPPDTYEFSRILHSIEDALGSKLVHDPVGD